MFMPYSTVLTLGEDLDKHREFLAVDHLPSSLLNGQMYPHVTIMNAQQVAVHLATVVERSRGHVWGHQRSSILAQGDW